MKEKKTTKVINMLGGSGLGKSTTAAGLYHKMKMDGYNVELVREYVKDWVWTGMKVGEYDQIYIFGKQARSEYKLYGKVEYIVTDSPILLSPIYEKFYNNGFSIIEDSALKFLEKASNNGVTHLNFLLERKKDFNPEGRYETEEQALKVDTEVERFLHDNDIDYSRVACEDGERVDHIMSKL